MKRALGERAELPGNAVGYDPAATFRPEGDILNIVPGEPGTGLTGYETKQTGFKEEELRREALQQEFENRMKAEETARLAAQLEMQQSEEARKAALAPAGLTAAELANQQARQAMGYARAGEARTAAEAAQRLRSGSQAMALAQSEETRKAMEAFTKYGPPRTPAQQYQDAIAANTRGIFVKQGMQEPGKGALGSVAYGYANAPSTLRQPYLAAYNQTLQNLPSERFVQSAGPYGYPGVTVTSASPGGGYANMGTIGAGGMYYPSGTGQSSYIGNLSSPQGQRTFNYMTSPLYNASSAQNLMAYMPNGIQSGY
jgi:hypothetical protein